MQVDGILMSHFIIALYQILISKCNLFIRKMLDTHIFQFILHGAAQISKDVGGTKHSVVFLANTSREVNNNNNDSEHVNTESLWYSLRKCGWNNNEDK